MFIIIMNVLHSTYNPFVFYWCLYYEIYHVYYGTYLDLLTKITLKSVAKNPGMNWYTSNGLWPLWEVISNNPIFCLPIFNTPADKIPCKENSSLILKLETRFNLGKVMDLNLHSQEGVYEKTMDEDRFLMEIGDLDLKFYTW